MTVADLIKALEAYPADAEVVSLASEPALGFRGYVEPRPGWVRVRRYRRGFGWVLHPKGRRKLAL